MKQYLTLDTKLSSQALSLSQSHAVQPLGVASILRGGPMAPASTGDSPVTKLLALGGQHENAVGESWAKKGELGSVYLYKIVTSLSLR